MSKLPLVSGPEVLRALQKLGSTVRRQHGSHIILRRDNPFAQTVVPITTRLTAHAAPHLAPDGYQPG